MSLLRPSPSSASSVLRAVALSVHVSPAWNSPSDGSTSLNPLAGRCFCRVSFPCSPQECSSLCPSGLQQTLEFQAPAVLLAENVPVQPCLGTGIDKVARLKQHQRTADVSLCCLVSENTVGQDKQKNNSADSRFSSWSVPARPVSLLLLLTCNVDASGEEDGWCLAPAWLSLGFLSALPTAKLSMRFL